GVWLRSPPLTLPAPAAFAARGGGRGGGHASGLPSLVEAAPAGRRPGREPERQRGWIMTAVSRPRLWVGLLAAALILLLAASLLRGEERPRPRPRPAVLVVEVTAVQPDRPAYPAALQGRPPPP